MPDPRHRSGRAYYEAGMAAVFCVVGTHPLVYESGELVIFRKVAGTLAISQYLLQVGRYGMWPYVSL